VTFDQLREDEKSVRVQVERPYASGWADERLGHFGLNVGFGPHPGRSGMFMVLGIGQCSARVGGAQINL